MVFIWNVCNQQNKIFREQCDQFTVLWNFSFALQHRTGVRLVPGLVFLIPLYLNDFCSVTRDCDQMF